MRYPFRGELLAGLAGWLILTATAGAQRPHFDPTHDYAYDLAETAAEGRPVMLDAGGFDWPGGPAEGDTAFLEIFLTDATGEPPEIKAGRGEVAIRQVFEAGARGRRLLDLSPLLGVEGSRVTLAGAGVGWRTGAARLFVYRNTPLDGRRVLVLAPHPDDAEIAAFGLYCRTEADVVTVTSGDAGRENYGALFPEPAEHYRVKGWIRTWDSISVPFYGGIYPGRARNLGFYDGTMRELQARPDTVRPPLKAKLDDPAYYRKLNVDPALRDRPFTGSWEGLVDDLVWELERVRPQVVVAPHPMLDNHADHQFTTIALIEALARWPGDCELYLYTNHGREEEAYPLGDRDAMTGLPAWSGGGLFFSRIYSHPLTPGEQKLKRVALEAMHDLRTFDLRDGSPPASASDLESWRSFDYFRRAPRPNELFFVVTRDEAVRLRDAFLAQP